MDEKTSDRRLAWWQHDRFGMFIHWGLYSITARDMWYYSLERVPKDEYEKLAARFNPVDYNPAEWAALAVEAGMRYAVITAKHHDGYCLYDTALTDFKATNSPCKRDLIADWVKAFRAAGLKVGFYYSLLDWHHPHYTLDDCHPQQDNDAAKAEKREWAKYVEYLHGQVREILTNYGKIDLLWADFSWPKRGAEDWQSERLLEMVRELQPDILVNNRTGLRGDFTTPEQYVPAEQPDHDGTPMPWETCMTLGQSWGYYRQDPLNKSTTQLIRILVECVSKNGNFLLNVGPTPRGWIQDDFISRLKEIGTWMRENGASIYGAGSSPYVPPPDARYTQRGDTLYLHLFNVRGADVPLPGLDGKVAHATLLRDGTHLKLKSEKDQLFVSTPVHPPDKKDTVVALQLTG